MGYNIFNAILSMDAYNRGYEGGIQLSDTAGTKIGNVTILDSKGDLDAEGIGFYAVAYDVGGAGTIIAYRGTDDLKASPGELIADDIWHGWSLGGGTIDSEQAKMAIDFYQNVTTLVGGDWLSANISLTGHSLGGGLAGYVGGIYL